MKTAEQFVTFGQGNVEALVQSSQVVATGMQDLGKMLAANAQASMDDAMGAFRALVGIRSMNDAVNLQASLARTAMEKTLAQTGQVAETSFKVAGQAMAPIASRMNLAVNSFGKFA